MWLIHRADLLTPLNLPQLSYCSNSKELLCQKQTSCQHESIHTSIPMVFLVWQANNHLEDFKICHQSELGMLWSVLMPRDNSSNHLCWFLITERKCHWLLVCSWLIKLVKNFWYFLSSLKMTKFWACMAQYPNSEKLKIESECCPCSPQKSPRMCGQNWQMLIFRIPWQPQ